LGDSPEGQRGPGRLHILQEGSLQGTAAGCPHVLQDKPTGKMTSLAEQAAFAWDSGKKGEFTTFGRKGRQLRKSTGISLGYAERKSER